MRDYIMKMNPEHYSYILSEIDTLLDIHNVTIHEVKAHYAKNKLTSKRMRWDLLYAAKLSKWVCDNLYDYLDDTHIDTALKKMTNTQ
jgi:hypothetical protein